MGVNSSQRLGVVVLPYKAAEAEGGRGRVGGEESQHPAAGAEALAAVEPEAREPLRRPPASSGPLPASAVRPPGIRPNTWSKAARSPEAQNTKCISCKP